MVVDPLPPGTVVRDPAAAGLDVPQGLQECQRVARPPAEHVQGHQRRGCCVLPGMVLEVGIEVSPAFRVLEQVQRCGPPGARLLVIVQVTQGPLQLHGIDHVQQVGSRLIPPHEATVGVGSGQKPAGEGPAPYGNNKRLGGC